MEPTGTFLAVFTGSKDNVGMKEWHKLSEANRKAKEKQGMAAWGAWMQKHQADLVVSGGPLGKTKKVGPKGVEDSSNPLCGFVVVRAKSHEAAADLFKNHPHFADFPGEAVEIMPIMSIPGA